MPHKEAVPLLDARQASKIVRDCATPPYAMLEIPEHAALQALADGRAVTVSKADADRMQELEEKAAKYDALHTPEIADFLKAVENEALYQREKWGSDHDAGKTDPDWFWLIGHLASKALLKPEKALHHIITTAAACLNWHAHKIGVSTAMRPGIGPDKQPPKPAEPADRLSAKE